MSDGTIATVLWLLTAPVLLVAWGLSVQAGIREGATMVREAALAAWRGQRRPAPPALADRSIPTVGLVSMVLVAVLVPAIYGTSTPTQLEPLETWFGITTAIGLVGLAVAFWEGRGIGMRRQAAVNLSASCRRVIPDDPRHVTRA